MKAKSIKGYQGEGSIVILLMDLNRDAYTILFEQIGDKNIADIAKGLASAALQKFKRPAFILCSTSVSTQGEYFDGETLVHGLANVVGAQANIFGGMAGDDKRFTGTYVFTEGRSSDVGIAALIIDEDKVSLQGMAIFGMEAAGNSKDGDKKRRGMALFN